MLAGRETPQETMVSVRYIIIDSRRNKNKYNYDVALIKLEILLQKSKSIRAIPLVQTAADIRKCLNTESKYKYVEKLI